MALEKQACDLFDGKQKLRQRLVDIIKTTRISSGLSPQDFKGFIDEEYSPDIISQIEKGKRYMDGEIALSLMAPLGISIDDAMPLPDLTEEQKLYWTTQYLISGDGPVHGDEFSREVLAPENEREFPEHLPEPVKEFNDDIQLLIYLRLRALKELNTP